MGAFQPKIPVGTVPQPEPNKFTPVFQTNVQAWGYGIGVGQPVNPKLCLSEASAKELIGMFADLMPTIQHMPPNGPLFWGNYTGMENPDGVPWFTFPDGSYLNAGADLASWFTHGYGQDFAMRNARGVIALNSRNFAQMNNSPQEQQ